MRSDLCSDLDDSLRGRAAPTGVVTGDRVDAEQVGGADGDRDGARVDVEDVARLTVLARTRQAEPPALTDGVGVGAGVRPDDLARRASTMSPGCSPSRAVSQARVSPSGIKQMSWESGLVAMKNPRSLASARISGLVVSPSGKKARDSWSASSTPRT